MGRNDLEYRIMRAELNESYMQTELIVLYLLEGEMGVRYSGDTVHMRKEDILLINSGMEYEIVSVRDAICGTASYSTSVVSGVMDRRSLLLYANSAGDSMHSYQDLRDILQDMTVEYILHAHQSRAAMESLMLKLLDCLIENYQINHGQIEMEENGADARMQQIMQYIINHIHDEISLSDIAAEMFVSTSTLSRIFKKSTGMYFADYVMRLRVRTSLGLLRSSDMNLTQIAMNCGFSTSSAFNRSFKKVMGIMPSEYRRQVQEETAKVSGEAAETQNIREELRKKGYQYSKQNRLTEVTLNLHTFSPVPYKHVWSECINVGSMYELSRANTQFHVIHLHEQLHFRYARIWNVFSVKMMVSDGKTRGQYNFDMINQVLDFLVMHHIKPFIDIGRRPDTAIRTQGNEVYFHEEYIGFKSREIWEDLFDTFLTEILRRYGLDEVSTWIFELTRDGFHEPESPGVYEDPDYELINVWKYVYTKIKERVPGARFGGISTALENDRGYVENFLRSCLQENCPPDFVSIFLYPYDLKYDPSEKVIRRIPSSGSTLEADRIEQYTSATGIVRRTKEILAISDRPSTLRDLPEITAKDVFDQAKQGDALALEIVDFVGAVLGGACAAISCVVDPEIFVIGGGVSKAGDILINAVRKYFRSAAFHASEDARFALATLGNDAGMFGSVKMVLEDS